MSEPTTPVDETVDPATPVAVRTARISLGIGTRVTAVQVSMSPVPADGLLESAQRHATRGLRARVAEEHDDACLQLGTMIEHLAMAYLASLDPTLVMESKFNLLSLLQLAGHGHRLKPGHVLKTVGVYEALTRIGTILNSNRGDAGQVFAARFAVVVDARNGVAHIGNAGSSVDEVAQLAVVFADEVLTLMGRQLADLFGPFTDAAEDLRQKCGTEVERRVKLLIAEAKQVFSRTYGEPDTPAAVEQLARIDRSTTGVLQTEHSQVAHSCPACEHVGAISGSADIDWDMQETATPEGYIFLTPGTPRAVLTPTNFRCPVCPLRLRGQEQLAVVGLNENVELGPASLDWLMEQYAETDAEADHWETYGETEPED